MYYIPGPVGVNSCIQSDALDLFCLVLFTSGLPTLTARTAPRTTARCGKTARLLAALLFHFAQSMSVMSAWADMPHGVDVNSGAVIPPPGTYFAGGYQSRYVSP